MKKRYEKNIENVLKEIHVSDDVLNAAKFEMDKKLEDSKIKEKKHKLSIKYVAAMASCLCILICAIIIPIMVHQKGADLSNNIFSISDLHEKEISSIDEYNKENNFELLFSSDSTVKTSVYVSDSEEDILIREDYRSVDIEYTLFVLLYNNYEIEEFESYNLLREEVYVKDVQVFYFIENNTCKAMFFDKEQQYFLNANINNEQDLINILCKIL